MTLKDRLEGYRLLTPTGDSGVSLRPGTDSRSWKTLSFVFMLSTAILAALNVYSWTHRRSSFEAGFDTDLRAAIPAIKTEKVRFTGGLRYDENGTLFHVDFDESTAYVGEPNPGLDSRWQRLLKGHWITLENDPQVPEVELHGSMKQISGLDVYHQLHCLNMVRKALHPEYYQDHDTSDHHNIHIDHCIDYLRQAIQCNADMTPITMYKTGPLPGRARRVVPDFQSVHTCRNFELLDRWSMQRLYRGGYNEDDTDLASRASL